MIHSFKFIGEGGAKLELRLDDGKHESVTFREGDRIVPVLEEKTRQKTMEQVRESRTGMLKLKAESSQPRSLADTMKMLSEIREEEGQKERDRIQKEGVGKVSIVIKKDKS